MITIDHLSFRWPDGKMVLNGISAELPSGGTTAVLGPNGSGKTTLFRCILGTLKPSSGAVLINGIPSWRMRPRQLASHIAYVPQRGLADFDGTVQEAVLPGLTRLLGPFSRPGKDQMKKVGSVLDSLGLSDLRNRLCGELSGGERQLVLLARALVQDAEILLMDEPDTSVDYGNRVRIMELLSSLSGKTVLLSTHDPKLALDHSDHMLVMKQGRMCAFGKTSELPAEALMRELYGLPFRIENIHQTHLIYLEDQP